MSHTMLRRVLLALLAVALAPAAVFAQAVPQPAPQFAEVKGEFEFSGILVARPLQPADAAVRGIGEAERTLRAAQAVRDLRGLGITRHFPEVDEYLVRVPAGQSENQVIAKLMQSGNFSYVEPDWIVFPIGCPNDALFSQQWHHAANRLASCAAWDIETGSNGVTVAICDTGVLATHEDLLLNRKEGFHVPTQKWESQGGPIADINGHGTNTTGSAAANGNNVVGVSGMGWNLGHRMMRVTDSADGSAALSNLTLAARTAADVGDKIASVSYSGVNSSSVFTTGDYVRSKGALLVWAAGNSNVSLSGNREDSVIVVGATDQNDVKASFSNYGPLVDLVAPGVNIRTTARTATNAYAYVSGTSFACPITAGLCALIWSRNPTLTPAQVEAILRNSCVDLGAAGIDNTYGYGRINAAAALAATPPNGPDTTPPAAPSGLVATPGNAHVDLTWNASTEPDLAGYVVSRSTSGGPFVEVSGPLSTPSFSDINLVNGVTYAYYVIAYDSSNNASSPSASVTATPNVPAEPVSLFANGFESGNLAADGWGAQNSNSFATTAAAFAGSWGARIQKNSWIERAVSTAGYANITVTYARRTAGLDNNEWLYAEWWNGSSWQLIEQTKATSYAAVTFTLPSAAANNAGFKIRFRTLANKVDEYGHVDAVQVVGTPN